MVGKKSMAPKRTKPTPSGGSRISQDDSTTSKTPPNGSANPIDRGGGTIPPPPPTDATGTTDAPHESNPPTSGTRQLQASGWDVLFNKARDADKNDAGSNDYATALTKVWTEYNTREQEHQKLLQKLQKTELDLRWERQARLGVAAFVENLNREATNGISTPADHSGPQPVRAHKDNGRTWAQVVDPTPARKVSPPVNAPIPTAPTNGKRSERKIIVNISNPEDRNLLSSLPKDDLTRRVRDSGNTGTEEIVAVRKLEGEQFIIHTATTEAKDKLQGDISWVKTLGDSAAIREGPHLVLAHGVPTLKSQPYDWDRLRNDILFENERYLPGLEIIRVGWQTSRGIRAKRSAPVIVSFTTKEMAERACKKGLIVRGSIHHCEHHKREWDVKQCDNCAGLGHIQTHCRKEKCCRKCHTAHEGECPPTKLKCVLCRSEEHTAFWMGCPIIQAEKRRLQEVKTRDLKGQPSPPKPIFEPFGSVVAFGNSPQIPRAPATFVDTPLASQEDPEDIVMTVEPSDDQENWTPIQRKRKSVLDVADIGSKIKKRGRPLGTPNKPKVVPSTRVFTLMEAGVTRLNTPLEETVTAQESPSPSPPDAEQQ